MRWCRSRMVKNYLGSLIHTLTHTHTHPHSQHACTRSPCINSKRKNNNNNTNNNKPLLYKHRLLPQAAEPAWLQGKGHNNIAPETACEFAKQFIGTLTFASSSSGGQGQVEQKLYALRPRGNFKNNSYSVCNFKKSACQCFLCLVQTCGLDLAAPMFRIATRCDKIFTWSITLGRAAIEMLASKQPYLQTITM